jgi:MarR family transcriptional regulator, temperature-dependent positive regulator of motility
MPVQFDEYDDEHGRMDLSEGTNAHTILVFLAENPTHGYSPKEIAEATGVNRGSVGPTLSRLEDRDLVRHKGEVWAIGDDDRLAAQGAAYVASSASITDNYYSDGA